MAILMYVLIKLYGNTWKDTALIIDNFGKKLGGGGGGGGRIYAIISSDNDMLPDRHHTVTWFNIDWLIGVN